MHQTACVVVLNTTMCLVKLHFIFFVVIEFVFGHEPNVQLENEDEGLGWKTGIAAVLGISGRQKKAGKARFYKYSSENH